MLEDRRSNLQLMQIKSHQENKTSRINPNFLTSWQNVIPFERKLIRKAILNANSNEYSLESKFTIIIQTVLIVEPALKFVRLKYQLKISSEPLISLTGCKARFMQKVSLS